MAPTRQWQNKLTSWRARIVADTARLRKAEGTTPVELWKERHKQGHMMMSRYEMNPNQERKNCYPGGQATSQGQTQTRSHQKSLRTGGLQWWRDVQKMHRSKWDGVHPKRFSCWRWDAQITEFTEYRRRIKPHKGQYRMARHGTRQSDMERNE